MAAGSVPLLINGLPVNALGEQNLFTSLLAGAPNNNRVLVLIQLNGGNDGLNTIIPLDQYPNLSKVRSNILINESKVLPLKGTSITGMHPLIPGIQNLYNNNMMTVVQGAGYPDPDFSHFRATDIKLTGSDTKTVLKSGWLGRYLEQNHPAFPKDYPNEKFPDPLAIKMGAEASTALQGTGAFMGIVIANANSFKQMASGRSFDPAPDTEAGHNLNYIRETMLQTLRYGKVVKAAADKQPNLSTKYPEPGINLLADQLKIVAQLIGGGLKTRIYMLNMNGFDTHNSQTDSTDPTKGQHAKLLQMLSEGLDAFHDDLHQMNRQDDVLCMTFSEFGRRIASNASFGTDHGTSEPMMLFGTKLKAGILGKNPTIGPNVTVNDNLEMQVDYRSVYATVLKKWLGVNDVQLEKSLLGQFPLLDLFNG